MSDFLGLILLVFALLFAPLLSVAEEGAQALGLGEQRSVPVDAGTRFSLGNPEVIQVKSVQVSGGKSLLLVKGKSQGYSDLILLSDGGVRRTLAFRVVSKRQAAVAGDGKLLFSPSS